MLKIASKQVWVNPFTRKASEGGLLTTIIFPSFINPPQGYIPAS